MSKPTTYICPKRCKSVVLYVPAVEVRCPCGRRMVKV